MRKRNHALLAPRERAQQTLLPALWRRFPRPGVAKVKNSFAARIQDETFPSLKALQTVRCPFKNLPETEGFSLGRVVNRRENGTTPLGQSEAGLPSSLCRMDGCRAPEA